MRARRVTSACLPSFSSAPFPPPNCDRATTARRNFCRSSLPRRRRGVATRTAARTDASRKDANARLREKLPAVVRQPRNGRWIHRPLPLPLPRPEGYDLPKQEARVAHSSKMYMLLRQVGTLKRIFLTRISQEGAFFYS